MFVVCQSIKLIPDIYEMIVCDHFAQAEDQNSCHAPVLIDALMSLAQLFCCINSSANFLFYMLRGKKFRDAFKQTYFCTSQGQGQNRGHRSPLGISLQTLDHNTTTKISGVNNRVVVSNGARLNSRPTSVAAV